MVFIEALILIAIVVLLLYKWSTAKYHILSERGIPHKKPKPFIGNIELSVFLGKTSFMRRLIEDHMKYKNNKIYGSYSMRDPVIIIFDTELIKKVGVKDFDHFTNHRTAVGVDEGILTKSLISLRDRKWKEMRNTLTPTFTGSKMRLMYELINECSLEGVKYIAEELQATGKQEVDLEMKEYFRRYANDVIATAAFGIKVNSFKDKSNEFFTIGTAVTQFRGSTFVKALLFSAIPKIMKALRIKLFDEKIMKYFESLVFDAMKYRQQHKIIRPDMIHLLMEAKRNFEATKSEHTSDQAEFNDEDLLAQCLLFFFAGFETVSTCSSFTSYELAMNQNVQQRLYEEISEVEKELNGKPLDYDTLMKMKYMDMVLSESLRKWPPAVATDRVCSADYELIDDEGNLVAKLLKGDLLLLPIAGHHYDPENFADPEKFDPERFSDENKHQIKPLTYKPFGVGPRNCIGNRLALMETKSIIYHIMNKFKMMPAEKTVLNMLDEMQGFQMKPKDGFWLKFEPRQN